MCLKKLKLIFELVFELEKIIKNNVTSSGVEN